MRQKLHPSIPDQSKRGFTLIELLVVIAIIGVLAGILVPAISGVRVSAHKAESVSQLKQIHAALGMYATEHKNTYPGPQGNKQDEDDTNDVILAQRIAILGDYLGPRDKWMHQVLTAPGVHPLLKSDLSANAPGDTKVFNFDLGGVVPIVMADGHVEVVEFDRLKRLSRIASGRGAQRLIN